MDYKFATINMNTNCNIFVPSDVHKILSTILYLNYTLYNIHS